MVDLSMMRLTGRIVRRRRLLAWLLPVGFAPGLMAQPRIDFGPPRAPMPESTLPLADGVPPPGLAEQAEVYVVSGYEAKAPRIDVRVDRPGKRVVLVLTSYEKILWRVEPTPNTEIAGVLISSYPGTSALQAPPGTPAWKVSLPYSYEVDNINFRQLFDRLHALFGIDKIDGLRGAYTLPVLIELRQPDPPNASLSRAGVQAQQPRRNFGFTLPSDDLRPIEWTLTGPGERYSGGYLEQGKVAISPDGRRVWRLRGDALEVLERGESRGRQAPLPPDFPSFSWAMDLAHDPKSQVLTIVTLGGEGFLYRYDTRAERWLDVRSLKDIDLTSLAFDPLAGRYTAWTSYGGLMLISALGHALMQRPVRPLLAGFGDLYDRNNGSVPRLTLAPRGEEVALVAIVGGQVRNIWVYDWQRHEARLTWKASGCNSGRTFGPDPALRAGSQTPSTHC